MSFFVGEKAFIEVKRKERCVLPALLVLPILLTSCLSSAEAEEWRLKHFLTQNRDRASSHFEMTMLAQFKTVDEVRNHMIYRMQQDRELQWSLDCYARTPEKRVQYIHHLADLGIYDNTHPDNRKENHQ